jgi:hypothetical protein
MKVLVTFKIGEEGQWYHTRQCEMEQTEYHLLKTDFLAYLNGEAEAVKGATYRFLDASSRQSRELVVRFDDVLYVEGIVKEPAPTRGIPEPANPTITGPLESAGVHSLTGPLSTRIAGSGESEP